jgi:hypothetical protein
MRTISFLACALALTGSVMAADVPNQAPTPQDFAARQQLAFSLAMQTAAQRCGAGNSIDCQIILNEQTRQALFEEVFVKIDAAQKAAEKKPK